jgi:GntR family transcriptional regulator of arabinose operon
MEKLKYQQLADHFRKKIEAGKLRAGEQLPSQQAIQHQFSTSQATVERAYTLLEEEGIIERRWRKGVFVRERPAQNATGNIGVIGSPNFERGVNPYSAHLMEGIMAGAAAESYHALILGNDLTWNGSECRKVDGILIVNIEDMQPLLAKIPKGMPCVSLLNDTARISCVKADNEGGGRLAAEYLISRGHRRIAFLKNNNWSIPAARQKGYEDALRGAGIRLQRSWIRSNNLTGHLSPGDHRLASYEQIRRWIQEDWRATGCTALLAQNDHLALGAIRAFQESGLRVPEDVSIIGFDGTELCDYFPPRLTSVKIPLAEIGSNAVKVLLQHLRDPSLPREVMVLPSSIREGESVLSRTGSMQESRR